MNSYKNIKYCRLCMSKKIYKILNFNKTPIGNNLLNKKETLKKVNKFPLSVNQCLECGHHQLSVSVNSYILYKKNYTYLTGTSKQFKLYLNKYSKYISKKIRLNKNDLVIDIGANDGTLLHFFKKNAKTKVLGIDPSIKPSNIAKKNNINFINDYFSYNLSNKIKKNFKIPKLVTSHNTFAHVKDLNDFFKGIDNISNKNTLVVIEIGYWLEVVKNNWFDTIYHEHHDYHSLKPLLLFFKKFKYNIIDFKITEPQGGSLMLFLKKNKNFKIYSKVRKQIDKENKFGLYNLNFYRKKILNLKDTSKKIIEMMNNFKNKGKLICAYGSPTKSVTLLSFIKLKPNLIECIYEDNKLKCNLFNPYYNIPILNSSNINKHKPDVLIILSWNFASSIISNVKKIYKKKIIFVIPLPKPYIVD